MCNYSSQNAMRVSYLKHFFFFFFFFFLPNTGNMFDGILLCFLQVNSILYINRDKITTKYFGKKKCDY